MERIRHRRSLLLNDISLHLVPLAVFLSDYQRMRLFGGQNHLIIFSRTNVSDHFLFSNGNSAFRYVLYSQRRQNETQPSFRTTAVSCVNSIFHSSPTIHVHFLPFELIQRNSHFWFLRVRTLHSPPQKMLPPTTQLTPSQWQIKNYDYIIVFLFQ